MSAVRFYSVFPLFCVKRAGTDRSLVQNARGVSRFRLTGSDILR